MNRSFQLIVITLLLLSPLAGQAQSRLIPPLHRSLEGEEITYNVRYGFFDLGQIKVTFLRREKNSESESIRAFANIQSYKGVPLVSLHATFETLFDTAMFSREFTGKQKEGDGWRQAHYLPDYPKNMVATTILRPDLTIDHRDTVLIKDHYQDGLSLFFFARDRLFSKKQMSIATLINEKMVQTHFDFNGKRSSVEIDAVDYPIDVVEFEGNAEFVGLFGLTGEFKGWFSNDDARVPILAKMKVILGSVTVELMEWKKVGWKPPKGK